METNALSGAPWVHLEESPMSFALSQRRTDRHPVGLAVVVGLHVLLAAVLLSAKLQRGPAEPKPIDLRPLDPIEKVEPKHVDLPRPQQQVIHPPLVAPPVITVEREPDAILVPTVPQDKPVVVASAVIPDDRGSHDKPVRVTARVAIINAGAAECRPAYPAAAQRAGTTGTTRIRFSVDAMGRISGSQIVQSSGPARENRLMDKAAADALAQCPVQVGTDELGRPTGTTTDVTYVWSLN